MILRRLNYQTSWMPAAVWSCISRHISVLTYMRTWETETLKRKSYLTGLDSVVLPVLADLGRVVVFSLLPVNFWLWPRGNVGSQQVEMKLSHRTGGGWCSAKMISMTDAPHPPLPLCRSWQPTFEQRRNKLFVYPTSILFDPVVVCRRLLCFVFSGKSGRSAIFNSNSHVIIIIMIRHPSTQKISRIILFANKETFIHWFIFAITTACDLILQNNNLEDKLRRKVHLFIL